jgi:hypothetical protein
MSKVSFEQHSYPNKQKQPSPKTQRRRQRVRIPRSINTCFDVNQNWPGISRTTDSRHVQIQIQTEYDGVLLTTSNIAAVGAGLSFALSTAPGSTTLCALFDQYRIDKVDVWMFPAANFATTGSMEQGVWTSAFDPDSGGTPASFNAMQAHSGVVQTSILASHYHSFVPQIAVAAYSGAFSSYTGIDPQWIDTVSSAVQHYGIQAFAGNSTTNGIAITYIARLTVSFRGLKA